LYGKKITERMGNRSEQNIDKFTGEAVASSQERQFVANKRSTCSKHKMRTGFSSVH
jgi:hypothetical protein